MRGKVKKNFVWIIFIGIVIVYILYHLFAIVFPNIKTESARIIHVFDSIDANAYIIRDEKIIEDDVSGFVNFTLNDADKIEKDGVIALVYSSESQGLLNKKIDIIRDEIYRLENLKKFSFSLSSSPGAINQQAYLELNELIKNVGNYEFNKLDKGRENILYLLNKRQIAAGQNLNLSEKISHLNNELVQLNAQNNSPIRKVLAQESGYFVGTTDGYENSFDYNNVYNITTDEIDSLQKNYFVNYDNSNTAKLVTDSKWFVACKLKKSDVLQLKLDQYVELYIPLASASNIRAKVVAINQFDRNAPAAVVFQCDYIDKNILSIRNEPIKINVAEYKGVLVNKSAVHEKKLSRSVVNKETDEEVVEEKLVKGVYIRRGKQLIFKEIDIIFSDTDYVICNPNPDKLKLFSEGGTVKEYDEVVVEGRNLYEGKFV